MVLADTREGVQAKTCCVDVSAAQQVISVTSGSNRVACCIEVKGIKRIRWEIPRKILMNIQDVHEFD